MHSVPQLVPQGSWRLTLSSGDLAPGAHVCLLLERLCSGPEEDGEGKGRGAEGQSLQGWCTAAAATAAAGTARNLNYRSGPWTSSPASQALPEPPTVCWLVWEVLASLLNHALRVFVLADHWVGRHGAWLSGGRLLGVAEGKDGSRRAETIRCAVRFCQSVLPSSCTSLAFSANRPGPTGFPLQNVGTRPVAQRWRPGETAVPCLLLSPPLPPPLLPAGWKARQAHALACTLGATS